MPRLTYSAGEAHALLTQADRVAAVEPDLAALYATLATEGIDLDTCTPDEDVREQLGMPPLQPAAGGPAAGDRARLDVLLSDISANPAIGAPDGSGLLRDYHRDGCRVLYVATALGSVVVVAYVEA
jgi:hypothetical protein